MYTIQKTAKILQEKFGKFLDPFVIFGIVSLFIIPVLVVLNLKPTYNDSPQNNVLGVSENTTVEIVPNTDKADGILIENVEQPDEENYIIIYDISPQTEGTFKNLSFTISNPSSKEHKIQVSPTFVDTPESSVISLMVDNVKFILHDSNGKTYPPTIYVEPGDEIPVYLVIENQEKVNFETNFSLEAIIE
ncbi:hypothetical protein JW710_03585 [Candidatus Dojkabacteria bacterium]|nr:hypothetical protein [Candidatus Dojkabacteria bacterium]